ncbi:hypothetical protein F2Q68_00039278 [Brassica cretica]|uniref:Uncharacterized protein n=1 Tax=Brassica cretica TaxID=69181 RepID=A0A8S9MU17_BRACR|nr:hypothetical protein F2Q68_00039278 [Brassica cretica]
MSIPAYGPIWVQDHMKPSQAILSKPRDGEVLLLYLKEQKHTASVVLVKIARSKKQEVTASLPGSSDRGGSYTILQKYSSIRQRYKGHWQGRQRSSPTSRNLHVSEGSTPNPSGSMRINSRTSGPQEDISVMAGFREVTSKMTKWKDLRPAKSTRNCRTTRSIKVTVPGSCPIELKDILKSSTKGNECNLDYGPHPIDIERGPFPKDNTRCRTEPIQPPVLRWRNKSSPPGYQKEFLITSRLQRRFNRNYEFVCDVLQYFRVVRQRTSLHASPKGLVLPEKGMGRIMVFTRLLSSTEPLLPRVRVRPKKTKLKEKKNKLHNTAPPRCMLLQKIILQPISNHGAHKQEKRHTH